MNYRRKIRVGAVALLLLGNGANAASGLDAAKSWWEGWRKGQIEAVGSAKSLAITNAYVDCRRDLAAKDDDDAMRFAVIKVDNFRGSQRHAVVPLPKDADLAVGNLVTFNIRDCMAPVERIAPVTE